MNDMTHVHDVPPHAGCNYHLSRRTNGGRRQRRDAMRRDATRHAGSCVCIIFDRFSHDPKQLPTSVQLSSSINVYVRGWYLLRIRVLIWNRIRE